jgi:hypothetical protein
LVIEYDRRQFCCCECLCEPIGVHFLHGSGL